MKSVDLRSQQGAGRDRGAAAAVPVLSVVAAAASWLLVMLATGRPDAMSHLAYLVFVLPVLTLCAAALGWRFGPAAWSSGPWMMLTHAMLGSLLVGVDGSLLPLGVLIFAGLAVALSGVAWISARISRALGGRAAHRLDR